MPTVGHPDDTTIYKLVNARLLIDHQLVTDQYLWFQGGRIIDGRTTFFSFNKEPDVLIDAQGAIVAPGFIDAQINGAFGVDFTEATTKEEVDRVAQGLVQYGCTAFCPTVVSSAPEVYRKLPLLSQRQVPGGAELLGAHLEGPFIATEKKGAHDQAIFQTAHSIDAIEAVYGKGFENHTRIVTLAPERVQDVIPKLVAKNITVSIGHSAATMEEAEEGIALGANFITHLFNAMKPFHHRDPGMIGLLGATTLPNPARMEHHPDRSATTGNNAFSVDPRPFYGIICDGVHVHPNSVRIAYYAHPSGCVLVTDALSAAGLPQGVYRLADREVETKGKSGAYVKGTDTLAGSTTSIDTCVRNFKKFTSCTTVEALEAATLHPAQMLGIQHRKGTLRPGSDADFVFLDDDLHVQRVYLRGQCVHDVHAKQ